MFNSSVSSILCQWVLSTIDPSKTLIYDQSSDSEDGTIFLHVQLGTKPNDQIPLFSPFLLASKIRSAHTESASEDET